MIEQKREQNKVGRTDKNKIKVSICGLKRGTEGRGESILRAVQLIRTNAEFMSATFELSVPRAPWDVIASLLAHVTPAC